MSETIKYTPYSNESADEFKTFFLQLLEEDAAFYHTIRDKFSKKDKILKKDKAENEPLPPPIPSSEMPYRKLRPDFIPWDPTPYAIKQETIEALQKLWKDAPPAEEIIAQLTK